ncbi:IPTL-CTERM sorting domain-containing protein [Diaphorobacter aerolatus]|uniref:IPTL-CTERM sorting domain-containing protein n=1 Tax=Diaphorobacter aerolatus TaxID=1288495 RepID=A0A7H0GM23_9BURK|nr:IPTL-CTERM sorting domain-containing protein [Diaphorobacter aerolatus]QNP49339.1 IPTL-CTERM sorting domain-containing protein [Diaphorobacter aerolatus]
MVTYTITVSNLGDTPLAGVSVTDPMSGLSALNIAWPDPAAPGSLPKGGVATATATYSIKAADVTAGQVLNTATAQAPPVAGVAVGSVSDTASIQTTTAPSVIAQNVPTLGEWGVIILSSLMAMLGLTRIRRRKF